MKLNLKILYVIGVVLFVSVFFAPSILKTATCPLSVEKPYKTRHSPIVYYISSDCTKRPIKNPEVFFSYFSSWTEVRIASEAQLSSIKLHPQGSLLWGPKKIFDEGSIIKSPVENHVYIIFDQVLHVFETEQDFLMNGYKWEWVEDVAPETIAKYSRGDNFSTTNIPEGVFFKYENSPHVYYIRKTEQGTFVKRHIESPTEFKKLGYRGDRIALLPNDRYIADDVQVNDEKRLSHIKQIQIALELYYANNGAYPTGSVELGNDAKCLNDSGFVSVIASVSKGDCLNSYMGFIPKGPGVDEYYRYESDLSGSTYTISATLESGAGGFGHGPITASPLGITQ